MNPILTYQDLFSHVDGSLPCPPNTITVGDKSTVNPKFLSRVISGASSFSKTHYWRRLSLLLWGCQLLDRSGSPLNTHMETLQLNGCTTSVINFVWSKREPRLLLNLDELSKSYVTCWCRGSIALVFMWLRAYLWDLIDYRSFKQTCLVLRWLTCSGWKPWVIHQGSSSLRHTPSCLQC